MKTQILFVALTFTLSCVLGVAAQDTLQVRPGARLRVTFSDPARMPLVGTYQTRTPGMILLEGFTSIPETGIARLEQSTGRKFNVLGGVIGGILGIAAGGAVGCLINEDDYGVFCGGQSDATVAAGAVLGGAAGVLLGGFLFRHEHWRPIDVAQLRTP